MRVVTFLQSKFPDLTHCGIMLAVILFGFTAATEWYYGNLSTYTDSYFIHQVGLENHVAGSMWFNCLYAISLRCAQLFSGGLANKIGTFPAVILSCVCFDISLFVTYFAVQQSFWAMNFTLGVLGGLCSGSILGLALLYAAMWFPKNLSLATSIVTSAYAGGGSLLMSFATTLFINPQNKAPDLHDGKSTYFTDPDILDRVPFVFLLLGGISTACHIAASALLLFLPKSPASIKPVTVECVHRYNIIETKKQENSDDCMETKSILHSRDKSEADSVRGCHDVTEGTKSQNFVHTLGFSDLTTREMLKTGLFYKIFVTTLPVVFVATIGSNCYKQFGMVHIHNDYFLTTVGILMNVTVCVSRVVWGVIIGAIDPYNSLILMTALITITYPFWYFTPLVSQWFYLIWTLMIIAIQNIVFLILPVLIFEYFGKTHYVSNYSALLLSSTIFVLLVPLMTDTILIHYGYFWLFMFVALCNFLGLCLTLWLPSLSKSGHASRLSPS